MFKHWEHDFLKLHVINYFKEQFKVFERSKQNRGEKSFYPKAVILPENP